MTDTERITRNYPAGELEVGDGRTIVGRCVPYDEVARVADPGGDPYDEVWRAGAFRRVIRDPGRTELNYEHRAGLADLIGHAVELEDRPDGLYGAFRALESPFGEQGLALIRSGTAVGLSVDAIVPNRRRIVDGVVERTLAVKLVHVALCRVPAYAGAGVTALRHHDPLTVGEVRDLEYATPVSDEVRAWLDDARVRFRPTS